jgi:uncharacterized membrane protein
MLARMAYELRLACAVAIAPLLAACGGGGSSDPGPSGPSFAQVYSTVVAPRCLPCHSLADAADQGGTAGMLDMSTQSLAYAALVNVRASGVSCLTSGLKRVAPGSAATSLMYLKVDAFLDGGAPLPCGDPMPDDGTLLTDDEAALVRAWIAEGARP